MANKEKTKTEDRKTKTGNSKTGSESRRRRDKISKTSESKKKDSRRKAVKKSSVEKKEKSRATKKENNKKENTYLAEWTAPEFVITRDEMLFYYASAILSVLMVVWSLYNGNFITAITFFLLAIVVAFHIYRQPEKIKFIIDIDGMILNDKLYRYDEIESFEVVQGDDFNVLKFKLKNSILPSKEIHLAGQDPYYIRAALEYFLPEKKQKETLFSFKKENNLEDEELSDEEFIEYLKKGQDK
jgi:hypothetical protein